MDTRIYVMTHKKIDEIPDSMYIPMQVGKEGKLSFGYIGDDTRDNISEKNEAYCELTGIYWLWKNVNCDIIGICHYRRYFVRKEQLLDKAYIERVIKRYPILISNSVCVDAPDLYTHYGKRHYTKDLDVCREVIKEKCPDYLSAFDYAMHTILLSVGNMWITRKNIFDRYCEWLFDILFEAEKRIDIGGYDNYQRRVIGFLAERLFRVWLLKQPEAVTEEAVKMLEPSHFLNAEKRVGLLYRCIKLKIDPVLHRYRNEEYEIQEPVLSCTDDFHGKIPVWVCWWQGEREMPEIISMCVRSIKRNLPSEQTEFRLITLENCMQYVTFTESIIRKFNEGKISYAHLSDLLRAELLLRYGGMWIDASYYVAKPMKPEIFDRQIYTIRFQKPLWNADIVQGRWSGNLWYVKKKKKMFQFLTESFWYYWETEEHLLDYFLIDYLIAAAVEEFPEIRTELEACGYAGDKMFGLQKWMNRKYSSQRIERILSEDIFYKLNWHMDYRKENMAGEKTVYGYLLE